MRKCNNCDRVCADSEKFCNNCGLPTMAVEEQSGVRVNAKPAKKKKTGLILGICGVVALIGALAAILLIPKRSKVEMDAMHRFINAQEIFLSNAGSDGATFDSLMRGSYTSPLREVSTDAELSLDLSGFEGADKLSNLKLLLQIHNKNNEELTSIQLCYRSTPIINACIEKTENGFGIYIPELSEKRYDISSELIPKALNNNFALPATSSSVSFDKVSDLDKSWEQISKAYGDIFFKGVTNDDFTLEEKDFRFEKFDASAGSCTEITFKPNAERTAAMLKELGEHLKTDKALSDHLLSVMERYLGESGMNLYLAMLSNSGEIELGSMGLLPIFEKIADEIIENSDNAVSELVDSGFTWRVVIKDEKVLAEYLSWDEAKIIAEQNDLNTYFIITNGGSDLIKVSTDLNKDGNAISGSITLDEFDNGIHAEIKIDGYDPNTKSALGVPYGKFDIVISDVDSVVDHTRLGIELEVSAGKNGGTDHRIVLKGLDEIAGYDMSDLSLNLYTTDKESTYEKSTAETVRIDGEEQLEKVFESLSENFEGVLMKLATMFLF